MKPFLWSFKNLQSSTYCLCVHRDEPSPSRGSCYSGGRKKKGREGGRVGGTSSGANMARCPPVQTTWGR